MAIPPVFILGRGHPQIGTTEGTMVSIYALSADENGVLLGNPGGSPVFLPLVMAG